MLDSGLRKKIEPLFKLGAEAVAALRLGPNQVTLLALISGLTAALLCYAACNLAAVFALWFSGYLDAVDGSLARKNGQSSPLGTVMDISFDRLVETALIAALAIGHEEARLALVFLSCAVILSMTVFLTTGSLAPKSGEKSFYYQPGLMERTEGFIFFTFMILWPGRLALISYIFALLVLFTAGQRFLEAHKIFR